jgi:hypothetical protein
MSRVPFSAPELSEGIPNGQVRVSTVEEIQAAGGDVIPTRRSPSNQNHVTVTGLSLGELDSVFGLPIPNPSNL